jgi:hypothetical protein
MLGHYRNPKNNPGVANRDEPLSEKGQRSYEDPTHWIFQLSRDSELFLISIASAGMESNAQDEEARTQAKAFYDRTVKQCGDLHYVWLEWPSSFMMQPPYWVLVQYKGLNIQISPRALSEADRLDGLEWQGEVNVSAAVVRHYYKDEKQTAPAYWHDWLDWSKIEGGQALTITMTRKGGKWAEPSFR